MSNNQSTALPPSYAMATGSSTSSQPASNHLEVPGARNGIPAAHRRSMEDEHRPLPAGWVRQFDAKEKHQFFVDTKADPPRSIWHHPYDDEQYLSTLTSEQREHLQEEERNRMYDDHSDTEGASPSANKPSKANIPSQSTGASSFPSDLPPRSSEASNRKLSFAEKLKQKATGMTKEERDREKAERDEQERQYYIAHQKFRHAVQQAQITGQPQFFAKDRDGKEIYVEPPMYGGGGYGGNAYGYNPYSSGPYSNPNARFVPGSPYARPYGPAYGYRRPGAGMPIAGGLLGGMLLGGLLF